MFRLIPRLLPASTGYQRCLQFHPPTNVPVSYTHLLSEQSGYSHLYTQRGNENPRQRTSGKWEVSSPAVTPQGDFLFLCNRAQPGKYEICRMEAGDSAVRELTNLGGLEDFSLSPDGNRVLLRHSSAYVPAQVSVIDAAGGNVRTLTDTRTPAFKSRQWIEPEIVQVSSQHGAGTVWGKYYGCLLYTSRCV